MLLIAGAAGLGISLAHAADDDSTLTNEGSRTDRIAASSDSQTVVVDRLSNDFSSTYGTGTSALINGLRGGSTTLTVTDSSGSTATLTPPAQKGKMGYGEIFIILALTQASATGQGTGSATAQQLATAMNTILTDRASGMGWGRIAKSLNLNLGLVIAQIRSGNERLTTAVRHERAERAARADRPDKADRPERPDKPDRPQRPDRPERPGKG
ncbi:MAG TPA: hypothetical protein VFB20_10230 [Burkholderiales bacterium]|nr:hypothetical protein [Burkholderiales bacterium]